MAATSVWRVRFHIEGGAAGKVTSGPYTTFAGISGGTRGDVHSPSIAASLVTAITNNLLGILQAQVNPLLPGAPSGTVVIDSFDHASVPDIWT